MSSDATKYWLGVSGETEWERLSGTTFSGVYAQMASVHMEQYGTTREQLSRVAVKNHSNGAKNPHAQLGFECSLEDAQSAPVVADPLNLYHCCPTSDGAACALIVSEDVVDEYTDDPIRVAGVGAGSDTVGSSSAIPTPASRRASGRPSRPTRWLTSNPMSSISRRSTTALRLRNCWPTRISDSVRKARPDSSLSPATELSGELPVNTSGGLKSKGHPIGATGAGQVVEAYKQLSGAAGERQVENPTRGLTHNVGGSGGASVIHIFEKEREVSA